MIKIPRLFDAKTGGLTPGCEWVLAGEGYATRKYDGSACFIDENGMFWKRLLLRKKAKDDPPQTWIPCEPRPEHGEWRGWIPVGNTAEDKWHWEAFEKLEPKTPGTFELIGPRIAGNGELVKEHLLIPHGQTIYPDCPREKEQLIEYLRDKDIEGIVFYHPDGRRAKVRKKADFGLPRRGNIPKARRV